MNDSKFTDPKKWLLGKKCLEIRDQVNITSDQHLNSPLNYEKFSTIDCFLDDNSNVKSSIKVYPSLECHLRNIISIDDDTKLVCPIDLSHYDEIVTWQMNDELRIQVCQLLVEKLSQMKPRKKVETTCFYDLKFQRRIEVLKMFLQDFKQCKFIFSKINYYRVFNCTKNTMLTCLIDIFPMLISGIPITVVSDLHSSIQIAFLRELLENCGVPKFVFNHLIDFEVSNQGQIGAYMLTETSDVYSALDNLFDTYIVSNLSCIKIFAQESLKSKIERIVEQKLKNQYANNLLFYENELFQMAELRKILIDVEASNIDQNDSGIWFYYYRHHDESISMINRLTGPNQLRHISIWTEETGMAYKIARQIKTTRNMSINCSIIELNKNNRQKQWPLELIAHKNYSEFINDRNLNLKKPNESWPLMNNRAQIMIEMLDKCSKEMLLAANGELVRLGIECHSGDRHLFEDLSANLLQLDYKSPLGNIIIHLSNENNEDVSISPSLLIFCFNILLDGNFLTLIGTKDILSKWKPIVDLLNTNRNTKDILQTIEYNMGNCDEYIVMETTKKWKNYSDEGTVVLLDDKGHIESLFIDQNCFQKEDHYWNFLLQWLRSQRQCSITIALQEYEMKNMVE